jgi:hypothetical protein
MSAIVELNQLINADHALLGYPRGGEKETPGKLGRYQEFDKGIIIEHPSFGTNLLSEKVYKKWTSRSVAVTKAHDGRTIRAYLGFPLGHTSKTTDGTEVSVFERGMIVCRPDGNSFVVYGEVFTKYLGSGKAGMQSAFPSWIGYPKADVFIAEGGGLFGHFENADIYWKLGVGAFAVHGEIRKKYDYVGGARSGIGYPLTNEFDIMEGGRPVARAVKFQHGIIIWRAGKGAFCVQGNIYDFYAKDGAGRMGIPASDLGFPTSDEKLSRSASMRYSNFDNGILVCKAGSDVVSKIKDLKFKIQGISTTNKADTGSSDDPYLKIKLQMVASSTGLTVTDHWFPNENTLHTKLDDIELGNDGIRYFDGQSDISVDSRDQVIHTIPVRDGDLTIDVSIETWDWDDGLNFGNNLFAKCSGTYNIDTLWDTTVPPATTSNPTALQFNSVNNNDEKARIAFNFDASVDIDPNDWPNFRKNLWWEIQNFKLERLSREVYAATFSDVDENENPLLHPFNAIFFEAVYQSLAPGLCFGMCAEGIYALDRRSISTQFVSKYQDHLDGRYGYDSDDIAVRRPLPDPVRLRSFAIMHGYQLGSELVRYYVSQFFSGEAWSPVHSFDRAREMFANKDYPMLVLSKSATGFSDGGHAVLPYHFDDRSRSRLEIYIADPNLPYRLANSPSHIRNLIVVENYGLTRQFNYVKETIDGPGGGPVATETWTGREGMFKGGRMFPVPYSKLSQVPTTPAAEIGLALLVLSPLLAAGGPIVAPLGLLSALFGGALFICGSSGSTKQVSDDKGRTYFNPDGSLNLPNEGGIAGFMHVPLFGAGPQQRVGYFLAQSPAYPDNIFEDIENPDAPNASRWSPAQIASVVRSKAFWPKAKSQDLDSLFLDQHMREAVVHVMEMMGSNRRLHFDTTGENIEWTMATGEVKYVLSTRTLGEIDPDPTRHPMRPTNMISIDALNMAGQAVTFDPMRSQGECRLDTAVVNHNNCIRFDFTNARIANSSPISFQHAKGGRKTFLYNGTSPTNVDVAITHRSHLDDPVLIKRVPIQADTIYSFEALNTTAVRIEEFAQVGQDPLSTETYSNIHINCSGLDHYWLTIIDTATGEHLASTDTSAEFPDSGGWVYCRDRTVSFLAKNRTYNLVAQSGVLSLASITVEDGVIHYDVELEGVLSGAGSNTLQVHGQPITFDTTLCDNDLIFMPGPNGLGGNHFTNLARTRTTLRLLPTAHTLEDGWAYYFIIASAVVAKFSFIVSLVGNVDYKEEFNGDISGRFSTTLTIKKLDPMD